jgi:hypothetical protein
MTSLENDDVAQIGWFFSVEEKDLDRVARIFLDQTYPNGKTIPNDHKLNQTAINNIKWP